MPFPPVLQLVANALAIKVLPVPAARGKDASRGGDIERWKTSGYSRGRRVISLSEWISAKD
jgi:hypothetical protein